MRVAFTLNFHFIYFIHILKEGLGDDGPALQAKGYYVARKGGWEGSHLINEHCQMGSNPGTDSPRERCFLRTSGPQLTLIGQGKTRDGNISNLGCLTLNKQLSCKTPESPVKAQGRNCVNRETAAQHFQVHPAWDMRLELV